MPVLSVGKTEIPYTIRHSDYAKSKRIIITPSLVEVIVPTLEDDKNIADFIQRKRRWVYDKQEEMQEKLALYETSSYESLCSGAKIPFRGRNLTLRIYRWNELNEKIEFRNGFHIYLPKHLERDVAEMQTGVLLSSWLKNRLREDVRNLALSYCPRLELNYKYVEVCNLPKMWGCCSKLGHIKINWHLIAAPKSVLEYVVLHELCHRKQRNHSPAFWSLIASIMPEYQQRKKWLDTANPYFRL